VAEAAVVPRRYFENGCEHQATYHGLDRQLFYFSPLRPHGGTLVLRISGANGKDELGAMGALPVYYRVETETGAVIQAGRVFLYGSRASADVSLTVPPAPPGSPALQPIWRLYTATTYGPRLELHDGAEELLLAVRRDDLAVIWGAVPQVTTTAIVCPTP